MFYLINLLQVNLYGTIDGVRGKRNTCTESVIPMRVWYYNNNNHALFNKYPKVGSNKRDFACNICSVNKVRLCAYYVVTNGCTENAVKQLKKTVAEEKQRYLFGRVTAQRAVTLSPADMCMGSGYWYIYFVAYHLSLPKVKSSRKSLIKTYTPQTFCNIEQCRSMP